MRYAKRVGCTVAISLVLLVLLQFCPGAMMKLIMFLSLLSEMALGTVFYVYHTETMLEKIIVVSILGVFFLFTVSQILIYKQTLRMTGIFMNQSKKFCGNKCGVFFYIPMFIIIVAAFLFLIYLLYNWGLSILPPTFDAHSSLYYNVLLDRLSPT